jgi:hypothetical protein
VRLVFRCACFSLSQSAHRDPCVVGVPQVRQGLGIIFFFFFYYFPICGVFVPFVAVQGRVVVAWAVR